MIWSSVFVTAVLVAVSVAAPTKESSSSCYGFPYFTRSDWQASPPRSVSLLDLPVDHVVIHHAVTPGCLDEARCAQLMRMMQSWHQVDNGWVDIGYNFAVGGDGGVYEGRGWEAVGAHAVGVNLYSIGIVLIGTFIAQLPPAHQLETTKALIAAGVNQGIIGKDYKLVGHRQMTASECPGDALFQEIRTWENYSPSPAGPNDPL